MHADKYFALLDCNNFYASCEQVFNPSYRNRPLVVLSNNDGCVIARSKEARALNIPMGAPAFQYTNLFLQYNVIVLSSNFALYGDMSRRINEVLKTFSLPIEIYSIDEAFMVIPQSHCIELSQIIRNRIKKWIGISISIGIAPTKTLAKIANHSAKKGQGIVLYDSSLLKNLPVDEIWGIGKNHHKKLNIYGIKYAHEFINCSDIWVRKNFSVTGLRTFLELKGKSCLEIMEVPPSRKSICISRSLKNPINTIEELKESTAFFISKAAEKMRQRKLKTHYLLIFSGKYCEAIHIPQATSYTPELINLSHKAIDQFFNFKEKYKRVGVMLSQFVSKEEGQFDFFKDTKKQTFLMKTLDSINNKFGRGAVTFAAEGVRKRWKSLPKYRSPKYTTSWKDLPKVK